MFDDVAPNTLAPDSGGRSRAKGDVPDELKRRYFLDGRGGVGIGFYVDARVASPAFRDTGGRLSALRSDPNVVRDLVAIARHRGWTAVVVRGEVDFRREAWLVASARDIAVAGYRPTARDHQELEKRRLAEARRTERILASPRTDLGRRADPTVTLRTVESVVQARVPDPSAQARIVAAARLRIADWLERDPTTRDRGRERQRTR